MPKLSDEQTVSEQQDAVVRVLTSTGGASRPYFIGLAADLGYPTGGNPAQGVPDARLLLVPHDY